MNWIFKYLSSSVGKKQVLGLTGLSLMGFIAAHMAGNLLFLLGPEKFNTYGHKLITNPVIIPMELGLVGLFLFHIILALKLTWENMQARPNQYEVSLCDEQSKFASATMALTGIWTLIFLIVHILGIKYGAIYETTHSSVEMRDLYKLMIEYFHNKVWWAYYVVSMVGIGVHLSHGCWSTLQTLGLDHKKYTPIIKKLSVAFGFIISSGFIIVASVAAFKGV